MAQGAFPIAIFDSKDQLNDYISRRFKRTGADPAAEQQRVKLEEAFKTGNVKDVTVRINPEDEKRAEEERQRQQQQQQSAPPEPSRMKRGDVIIPEGAPLLPPMTEARFCVAWAHLVNTMFPGEIRQPTLDDLLAWKKEYDSTPEPPNPLAHLIQVSEETWDDIKARSDWNRPAPQPTPEPRQRGSHFGDGMIRPGGR